MFSDWDLIVSSLAEQYGIRVYSKDFQEMKWREFRPLLIGIGPETALGRIVSIRAEDDEEVLKNFTPEMKRIRNEWRNRMAKERSEEETMEFLESMKQMFIQMAGDNH